MVTAATTPARDAEKTLIAGRWTDSPDPREVRNPADGSVVATIGYGGAREARAAGDAAADAFGSWSRTTGRERAEVLARCAEFLHADAEPIGRLLCLETGKLPAEAVAEIRFAAEYFRYFAERARDPQGEVLTPEAPDRRQRTFRRPAGVVACLTPWNFPVSIQARKVAPALAAGCTVVSRPSEKAPLAVAKMFRCLDAAGFPPGVVNLVHGAAAEITEALLAHPAVRVVSFTGSTEVGRRVMRLASERIVRPALELGGDAPFVVFDDADLDQAVAGAMVAKFRNNGQSCIAANRFFVHDRVRAEFVDRLTAAIDELTVGDPLGTPAPTLGPLIDEARVNAVNGIVDEALSAGARRTTRHDFPLPRSGTYAPPALLVDVPDHVALARSEVFGPVAGVFGFESDEDLLARANATEVGLAAYVYTRDLGRAERIPECLEAGIVGVNTPLPSVAYAPLGGVKQSGLGREGGPHGLEEFQQTRYVAVNI
ncbi:NAD-dependent succinate-semialdehyde dehydrogenase [Actinopolymorpha sp. B11F2]|uniref:NAD-dependent succinate-semialdehyde dehydrogenase n=1 Tax=Actinopolymorpha sp. B11F2 TaxID=3160862 RepID=UPI0032E36B63